MVTLETAEKALKTVYLGVVQDQLNTGINPFLAKIEQTTSDVWGKEIVKMVPYGLNGGVGAGAETGELPAAGGNYYKQFRLALKNLYGTIEISDKAIMASQHSAGAFVNLLNAEMEGLLKASKFNLGRMLYGDGSGKLCKVQSGSVAAGATVYVDEIRMLMEGMTVDIYSGSSNTIIPNCKGRRIKGINRSDKLVSFEDNGTTTELTDGDYFVMQNSKDKEITGLGKIFDHRNKELYGLNIDENLWLKPNKFREISYMENVVLQDAIDRIEENAGTGVDMIITSNHMKRKYLEYMSSARTNIDYMTIDGGYKAMSYSGIPMITDKFCDAYDMYFLNSSDFKLHQLCDWRWLEGENGKVIKQKQGLPCYQATLVKYADMICDRPIGQAKIEFII